MRILFVSIALVSLLLLMYLVLILNKRRNRLNDTLRRMLLYAMTGVASNIVIASSGNWFLNNICFTIYFSTISFVTYYMLLYCLIYTDRQRFVMFATKIYRFVIIIDAVIMFISIWTNTMFTMYIMELDDGTIAFQTRPSPFFNIHLLLCYFPIILGMASLLVSTLQSHSFYRIKYFSVFSAIVAIVILNIVYMMFNLPFDWSVLFYGAAAFILFYISNFYVPGKLMSNTLNLAVDSMKEGLLLFDAERNCIYINNTAKRTFNIDKDSLTPSDYPLSIWLDGKDKKTAAEFVETFDMEIDGSIHSIRVDFKHCLSKKYHILGSFFLFEDITDDVRLMKNLEEAKAEAYKANSAKSMFLANMSHEIRTPINSILGMNEMILREASDKNIIEYAGDIDNSGNALLSLINNILDFSKIESGKMEIKPEEYTTHQLVRECYSLVAPRAQKKDLPIRIECDEKVPKKLIGDMSRIRQVLVNLLTNSVKYTKYGHVGLKLTWEEKGDDTGTLGFVVSDTGQGISEEDISRLFRVFQRVDEQNNRNIEGTGLGLAISRELMSMMNGTISVESSKGIGSKFTMSLPQRIADPTPSGEFSLSEKTEKKRDKYLESFHAPEAKILVVDDIELNLKLIAALLKKTQVQIVTAEGGNKAIEMCENEEFDLILMDHMMPPPDGVETMETIKRMGGHNAGIPFIVLTANAIEGAEKTYLDLGFDGYLSKPVLGADLEDTLKNFLPEDKLKD